MDKENNMWSVVLVFVLIALLVSGSLILSLNLYDGLYLAFILICMFKFIYLRKHKSSDSILDKES